MESTCLKKGIDHEQGDEKRLTLNEYDHNIKENEREVRDKNDE